MTTMVENKDKKVLNVPHLRFPEFSGEWEKCKFKDVCKVGTGNKNTQDKVEDGLFPFYVRSQNIERINSWSFEGEAILTAGDGAVGKVFHYSIGKIGVHQRVYILSDFKCDGKYLYQYFSSHFYNRVKRLSAKNTVDSVRMEMITEMPLSLPSIEEQTKIGRLLSLLDKRIATQNKIIEDLKKLKSAIAERVYNCCTYQLYRIGDVIEQVSKRNTSMSIDKVLSVSNKLGFINQSEQFEDRIVASEDTSNYKIVYKDDFAYNPARINVGSIARLKHFNKGIVSPMYICFRVKQGIVLDYLEYFFTTNYFFYEMQKRLEGSVRQCLSFEGLCNIPIYIPNLDEQQKMGRKVSVIMEKIDIENRYLDSLKMQKQYLLRQMFI